MQTNMLIVRRTMGYTNKAKASYRLYSHSDMLIERALASLGTLASGANAIMPALPETFGIRLLPC